MKTKLALVMIAVAGSVNAQAETTQFSDDPATQPPPDSLAADLLSAPVKAVDVPGYPSDQNISPPPAPQASAWPSGVEIVRAELVQAAPPQIAPPDMPQPTYAPAPLPVSEAESYQYFYQPLRPYGEWVFIGGHGPCWRPGRVAVGWRPYFEGRWVWTDCGWSWVSAEPWGWATYHYGRWMLTPECGWVWVPGRTWAPAWVAWRNGPDFVGWAPLPPGVAMGVGFSIDVFGIQLDCWTMVHHRDFLAPRCARVAFHRDECRRLLPRATALAGVGIVNNVVVNVGPGHRHIETVTGHRAPMLRLRETTVSNHRPPASVERNALVVGRPAASLRSQAVDASHIRRASTTPEVRVNTQPQPAPRTAVPAAPPRPDTRIRKVEPPDQKIRPQSRATMPVTVTNQRTESRPPAMIAQPAPPARVAPQPPSNAPPSRFSNPAPVRPNPPSVTTSRSNAPASRWSPPAVQSPVPRQPRFSATPSARPPSNSSAFVQRTPATRDAPGGPQDYNPRGKTKPSADKTTSGK